MPHLQLELTANLCEVDDLPGTLAELAQVMGGIESVDPKAVKAYAHVREHWAMGEEAKPGFIHLTICVLSGRPLSLRRQMGDRLCETLKTRFSRSLAAGQASLTLEVREMDPATYLKS